jgi:hypothetical protein
MTASAVSVVTGDALNGSAQGDIALFDTDTARRYLDDEAEAELLRSASALKMARIAVRPRWVGLLDFRTPSSAQGGIIGSMMRENPPSSTGTLLQDRLQTVQGSLCFAAYADGHDGGSPGNANASAKSDPGPATRLACRRHRDHQEAALQPAPPRPDGAVQLCTEAESAPRRDAHLLADLLHHVDPPHVRLHRGESCLEVGEDSPDVGH